MKPGVYVETDEDIVLIATLEEVIDGDAEGEHELVLHDVLIAIFDAVADATASPDNDDRILTIRIVQ